METETKMAMPHEDKVAQASANKSKSPLHFFTNDIRNVLKWDKLGAEIGHIAFPAALALTADPIASLVDTAFIGHIGPVELAAVGVAIAVFNQISKVAIFPVVSITTSFVAEEDAACEMSVQEDAEKAASSCSLPVSNCPSSVLPVSNCPNEPKVEIKRKHIPSVSSALVIGGLLGILQALFLLVAAKPVLNFMGIKTDSPMLKPARDYLILRSVGAPAILLSLAMQGVFRGFKDTKTPLYAIVAGDLLNIVLDPIFMFVFHLGVCGAAIAHVISQYVISLILLLRLMTQVKIMPPRLKDLQFRRFLKNGFPLLGRVIAATFCVTLAASMAARLGPNPMAAFQICLQVWLATSLLADGLAVAGQAILASAFAKKDHEKAIAATTRVLQLSLVLGMILTIVLGGGMQFASRLFTKDVNVLKIMHIGIPFVAATQPLNTLAFVVDGINFGASDFMFAAYSMILVAVISIVCLFLLSAKFGFIGIWVGLTIYMCLRMAAGFWRMGTASGPWTILRS